jgi:hypothetical protein
MITSRVDRKTMPLNKTIWIVIWKTEGAEKHTKLRPQGSASGVRTTLVVTQDLMKEQQINHLGWSLTKLPFLCKAKRMELKTDKRLSVFRSPIDRE